MKICAEKFSRYVPKYVENQQAWLGYLKISEFFARLWGSSGKIRDLQQWHLTLSTSIS